MGFGLSIQTPPAIEPVTLTELQTWCRVDEEADNDLLVSLGKAARRLIEQTFDLALISQTLLYTDDRFPRYSSSAVWQYNSDAIWQQRLPVTQLSGQWYPDRASIRLPRSPLLSVATITYIDGNGMQQTVDPTTYNVDTTRPVGRIAPSYGNIWPIVRQQLAAMQVTFTAGFGATTDTVPETFKTAIKLTAAAWYQHRGDDGGEDKAMPRAAEMLCMSEWDAEYR